MPTLPKGIDSLPAAQVPNTWSQAWFVNLLKTWLFAGDVRNATGVGITISGNGITPATLTLNPVNGKTVVITTAKLTNTGTNGSLTFTNGILTAYTQAS